jgi:hypothetical protein
MRALTQLVAHRRRVVVDTGRMTHRLTRMLKNFCPHVLHGFPDTETPLFGAFRRCWPTLTAVRLARRSTLGSFYRDPQMRSPEVSARRLQAIRAALPLTADEGASHPMPAWCPPLWPNCGSPGRRSPLEPSRLPALPGPPRGRACLCHSALRRLRGTTRTVSVRHRPANIGRERARHGMQRQAVLGPRGSPVAPVPAPIRRGVGRCSAPACYLGSGLLPAATRQGESTAGRCAGARLSREPYPVSVLARAHPIR